MYRPGGRQGVEVPVLPQYRGGGGSQAGSTGSNRDSFTEAGGAAEVQTYGGTGGSRTGSTGSGQVDIFAGKDDI